MDPKVETRIQALEVGVNELKQQNAQFMTWFQEAGDRMQKSEQTMWDMQHSLNKQQQDLQLLNGSVQQSLKSMKNELSHEMSSSFQNQTNQLMAMLEKRQRND